MRRMKLFPRLFLYTLALLTLVVLAAHGLLHLLAPRMQLSLTLPEDLVVSVHPSRLVAQAVARALPWSLGCSLILSALGSFLLSRAIAGPVEQISAAARRMGELDPEAACPAGAGGEIGELARDVNRLYAGLLSTIRQLEGEKEALGRLERAKVDFLRAASHELKTPVTALRATLENMALGVEGYRDWEARLPDCLDQVDRLSGMIHDLLEASRLELAAGPAAPIDLVPLVEELCQPCRLIARARGLDFSLRLPEGYPALAAPGPFRRAVSSILSNAVTYAQAGGLVSVYLEDGALVVENQCDPIPAGEVRRLFQPFCRPDLSRSRESGGNGLGLYFADSLLTAMGLRYAFGPMEEPQGMRFTIWLE